MLLPHFKCVCIGSQYLQKNLEKHCKNLASLDFANFFLEIFANISILYTHIFSVAKAFTQTKLHSSENKVPSSILHLMVESIIITAFQLVFSFFLLGGRVKNFPRILPIGFSEIEYLFEVTHPVCLFLGQSPVTF